jgi:hypothetical protein
MILPSCGFTFVMLRMFGSTNSPGASPKASHSSSSAARISGNSGRTRSPTNSLKTFPEQMAAVRRCMVDRKAPTKPQDVAKQFKGYMKPQNGPTHAEFVEELLATLVAIGQARLTDSAHYVVASCLAEHHRPGTPFTVARSESRTASPTFARARSHITPEACNAKRLQHPEPKHQRHTFQSVPNSLVCLPPAAIKFTLAPALKFRNHDHE